MKSNLLLLKFKIKLFFGIFFSILFFYSCDKECKESKCEEGYLKIYSPVCGCNNITYSNSSEAECKGIKLYTDGKCEKEEEEDEKCKEKVCDDAYIKIYDPVCGCNNITYSNSSEAECKGIKSYTKGKCEKD